MLAFLRRPSWTSWAVLAFLSLVCFYLSDDFFFVILAVFLAIPAILGAVDYVIGVFYDLRKAWREAVDLWKQEKGREE